MGNCFPSIPGARSGSTRPGNPCANVVSDAGEFREFSLPVTVSQVLESLSSSPDAFFLCNSDRLYFDDYIPSLELGEELRPGQIYFLLPASKLQYPLAPADMAALAVKASAALEQINGRRKRKTRISPFLEAEEDPQSNHTLSYLIKTGGASGNRRCKPPAAKRLTKYSSRRAKWVVRSFRTKLATINEGSSFHLMRNTSNNGK